MRSRSLAVLFAVAASSLVLAGCTGDPTSEPAPSGSPGNLCDAAQVDGDVAQSVTVTGETGSAPKVEFAAPLEISEQQRHVITEGGTPLDSGDFVRAAYTVFDAETGDQLGTVGYEDGEVLPEQVSPEGTGQLMGCSGPGSRMVVVNPPSDSSPGLVYVIDILDTVPTAAWGEEQSAVEGMPTVTLAKDGAPEITVPKAEAPTEVKIATLKEGDGVVVQPGATVLVQYTGVLWDDGTEFDSSWTRGMPATFKTTGVVTGFGQALEGAKVGSQVLVVIPPEFGYPKDNPNSPPELAGKTLVFVVDILGAQSGATG